MSYDWWGPSLQANSAQDWAALERVHREKERLFQDAMGKIKPTYIERLRSNGWDFTTEEELRSAPIVESLEWDENIDALLVTLIDGSSTGVYGFPYGIPAAGF